MQVIVNMEFGSHLYGTATESSDRDYKGIFMPCMDDILLGLIQKSINNNTNRTNAKNTQLDVDEEFYSLHYFVKLALQGETVALDMLHAPPCSLIAQSPIWKDLQSNRSKFYTRNLRALVGYVRKQASKYGVKGSRLASVKRVLQSMGMYDSNTKLTEIWQELPEGEHIRKELQPDGRPERVYDVCGKKLIETATIGHYKPMLEKFMRDYGNRAKLAERNEGIDWKAISHALRAGYQVKSILQNGGFEYPLSQADFLRSVKAGEIHYKEVAPQLEDLIDECESLSERSMYPHRADSDWWDSWLVETIKTYYKL